MMHRQFFTISDMAELIAQADNLDEEATEKLHQRLRGARQRGLLVPVDMNGPRGAAQFDVVGLAQARLIDSLMEMRVEIEPGILEEMSPRKIGQLLTDIRLQSGEPWQFHLYRILKRSKGRKSFVASLRHASDFSNVADRIVAAGTADKEEYEIGRIIIPASLLVASVVNRVPDKAAD